MKNREQQSQDPTLALWQRRTSRALSHEDCREMSQNISGFFKILREWKKSLGAPVSESGVDQDEPAPFGEGSREKSTRTCEGPET